MNIPFPISAGINVETDKPTTFELRTFGDEIDIIVTVSAAPDATNKTFNITITAETTIDYPFGEETEKLMVIILPQDAPEKPDDGKPSKKEYELLWQL